MTPNINLKDENFNGIRLNQPILPIEHATMDINNLNFYYLENGLRLITDDNGNINHIAITQDTDKTVATSKGITVGDSLEAVKKQYGEDYYSRREQGVEIIVYVDHDTFLEFWHYNNEVQEIRFGTNEAL